MYALIFVAFSELYCIAAPVPSHPIIGGVGVVSGGTGITTTGGIGGVGSSTTMTPSPTGVQTWNSARSCAGKGLYSVNAESFQAPMLPPQVPLSSHHHDGALFRYKDAG